MCGGESALSVGEHQLAGIRQTGLAQGRAYFAYHRLGHQNSRPSDLPQWVLGSQAFVCSPRITTLAFSTWPKPHY